MILNGKEEPPQCTELVIHTGQVDMHLSEKSFFAVLPVANTALYGCVPVCSCMLASKWHPQALNTRKENGFVEH